MAQFRDFAITQEEKEHTPSSLDGISPLQEDMMRSAGCDLIEEGGILLRLPQAAMCTAQILLQRFFFFFGFGGFGLVWFGLVWFGLV